jgi:hypothetical protein
MLYGMRLLIVTLTLAGATFLTSCARKDDTAEAPKTADTPATAPAASPSGGPHAVVHLTDGSKIPGAIVASTQTDMTVDGDDGIERKIPLEKVKSVEYGAAKAVAGAPAPAPPKQPAPPPSQTATSSAPPPAEPIPAPAPAPPPVTTKTNELPAGAELSVRTNESIDSATAQEGQAFEAQVTRTMKDADGDVVIPRGAPARIVIKSASKGGKFHGQSDLVLDLISVTIDGRSHAIDVADLAQKGKDGVGVNKRTATYSGGGAALGAIIGAIAGGGKGAAIGAGAGAGAGALTQVLTKGGSIKIPAESVLTFRLDKPLRVTVQQ